MSFAQNPKHRDQTEAIGSKSRSSGGPKVEGGDSYWAHLVAKQLLKARSHVSKGQLFLGPPDFGGSPHTHTHLEVQLQCLLTRPTSPPCPHPTPPTRTGSSESESLPETWGAPSRASALPAAQLPGFLLGHPVPRALLGRSAPGQHLHPGNISQLGRSTAVPSSLSTSVSAFKSPVEQNSVVAPQNNKCRIAM